MKKIIAVLLAALMLLAMGAAYAEEEATEPLEDTSSVDLVKIYKLKNEGTFNPAETFNFTLAKESVAHTSYYTLDSMPVPATSYTIDFTKGEATTAGANESAVITLPNYDHVGVFTYKITETAGTNAGVSYDTTPVYMVVTVSNDPDKAGSFIRTVALHYGAATDDNKTTNITNMFYASGDEESKDGGLWVTKTVTGNMGEKDRYFPIVVTLTAPAANTEIDGVTFPGTVVNWDEITMNGDELAKSGVYGTDADQPFTQPTGVKAGANTFYLKDGETLKLFNLPYGVTYTVSEETPEDYKTPVITDNGDGVINTKAADTVDVVNEREIEIVTGIILQYAPYIAILAVVLLGAALMIIRRRRYNDD